MMVRADRMNIHRWRKNLQSFKLKFKGTFSFRQVIFYDENM